MANVFDYLYWRGDLSFEQAAFCEIDSLIFCRLSYIRFDGVLSAGFSHELSIAQAAQACRLLKEDQPQRLIYPQPEDEKLLGILANCARFQNVLLSGYVNRTDRIQEKQFAAVTARLTPQLFYVAYRGTDNTVVGWKEDFNLTFQATIPAQVDARAYLENAAAQPGKLLVGGHSKGGNLAVFAAARCPIHIQNRIVGVYNHDGPGFAAQLLAEECFKRIRSRIHTYIPQSSVVGLLLEHEEEFSVIHSTGTGLMQHDLYSWEISPQGFVPVRALTNSSQFIDLTLKRWLAETNPALREAFIDSIYESVTTTGAKTLPELYRRKNAVQLIKSLRHLDENSRKAVIQALELLLRSAKKAIPAVFKGRRSHRAAAGEAISSHTAQNTVEAIAKAEDLHDDVIFSGIPQA